MSLWIVCVPVIIGLENNIVNECIADNGKLTMSAYKQIWILGVASSDRQSDLTGKKCRKKRILESQCWLSSADGSIALYTSGFS